MNSKSLSPPLAFVAKLGASIVGVVASVATLSLLGWNPARQEPVHIGTAVPSQDTDPVFSSDTYSLDHIANDDERQLVSYGKQLIQETYRFIGPNVDDPGLRFAGNELACKNCHLQAGLKKFAAPYVGVTKRYPNFRNRENRIGTIEQRINGCMERSMNGRPLPEGGHEMQAIVAYMDWLSRSSGNEDDTQARGFVRIDYPDRAVDLERGKRVYVVGCASCHGPGGTGQKLPTGHGYQFPPVAGDDSYNSGAGMHRVLTAMAFIKGNMPLGAMADHPLLTDSDAYDVAGYINSLPRPEKDNTEQDFPNRVLKPMSTPYPPYADDFPQEQHKYGPFQPIYQYYAQNHALEKRK